MNDRLSRIEELETRCRELEEELVRARQAIAGTEDLQASRMELERAQSMARVGSWRIDLESGVVTASPETRRIYGVDGGEWTLEVIQNIPLPEYRDLLDRALKDLVEKGTEYDVEFKIRRRSDDAIRHIHSRAEYDAERHIVIGTIHDNTGQKEAEEEIHRNRDRLRALVEILQDRVGGLQEYLDQALEKALQITGSRIGSIFFYNEESQEFELSSWSKEVMTDCAVADPQTCFELADTGIWGEVVRRRRPILLNDFHGENPLKRGYPEGHISLERFLAVPVFWKEKIMAVVGVANKASDYEETDVLELTLLMDTVWKSLEHRKSQEALRESEHMFRSFVENANDVVYSLSPEGAFRFVSSNWIEFMGEEAGKALGRSFEHYVHPDDIPLCREYLETVVAAEERVGSVEYRVRHADGSWRWHVSNGSPLLNEEGERVGYVGIARDVTERREHDARMALLAEMLDEAPAAVTIHDREGQFLFANRETFRVHGYETEGEFMNLGLEDIDVPEGRSLIPERMARIMRDGEARFEVEHFRKDGSVVPLEVLAKAIDWHGREAVLSIATDISERRRTEEALEKSHALLENLASLVPGVIYQYRLYPDGRSCFPYASPGMWDIYEVTSEEVREDATPVFGRLHPEDAEGVSEAIAESARTLKMFYTEFKVLLPEQGLRWRWSQARPQRMEDGGTLWHGIILDVTGRKQAEEEWEKLRAQLDQAQKMESVGRLAGGVAHDFNNMLNVILGHADFLLQDLPRKTSARQDVEEIKTAALRSAELTRQLLAFARKQTIAPRMLDLNRTIGDMLKMLQRLIGEDIDLGWAPGEALEPILIDPGQVDQILVNLCVNARDAIGKKVGRITIETGFQEIDETFCADHPEFEPGRYAVLSVSDDGCGMDRETKARIFEPFFTTKRLGEGTGLGLATVYGIVKQNEGFIDVHSEPGSGTTFRIYLPVPEVPRPIQGKGVSTSAVTERSGETVLLVEDEEALLRLNSRMLERLGYQVIPASTPGEAIRLAQEHREGIHLLVTDVVMPEMNGRDLARQLLSLYPGMRRLFMSGYTADVIAHHGVLDEGVHFLQKPFSIAALAEKLREVLDDAADAR